MRLKAEKIDLSKELEKRIGKRQLNRIIDKALLEAGKVVLEAVKANIRYFRDTGAEYGEAKLSDPKWERGQRTVRIYWKGEKHRYSVVHLNEKGFYGRDGKFVKPKGMGAIDIALRASRERYFRVFEEEVQKLL